jgi:hypothetical protein
MTIYHWVLSPREIMFLGCAIGWIACAVCFLLIPSWRARDVRSLDTDALLKLTNDVALEIMRRNPGHEADFAQMRSMAENLVKTRKPFVPRYDDDE